MLEIKKLVKQMDEELQDAKKYAEIGRAHV